MNYTTGTITLANGSNTVTGTGTGWATALIAGGVIYPQAAGNPLPIASVDSNTAITAATEWTGATGTYAYALSRQDDENQVIANAIALADYIARLGKPSLAAIAGLTPEADKFPYYNGSSSADLTTLTAFARTLLEAGNASTALTTLGVTPFSQTLLDDPDAAAALTTLGVTPFSQTLLDDPDAAEARQTLNVAENSPGKIAMFAMPTAPTGWLKANGAEISRTTYSDLFSAIGTTYGDGDGSTTFAIPDIRGEFLRSLDLGRGADPGRALGSYQASQNLNHSHRGPNPIMYYVGTGGNVGPAAGYSLQGYQGTDYSGGSEARPRNIALLACIKY